MGGLSDNRYVATFVWQAVSPMLEKKALVQVREFLAKRYRFNPADTRAITMRGSEENQEVVGGIVTGLKVVLTFIGVLTLAIGGVGIMNIMFVNVQERTREIGVRKALGATPSHIVTSIVQESIFITTIAGYLGLVAGVGALALIDSLIPPTDMFAHPEVDLKVALGATVLLVIAGALAGLFPARAAAGVNPIVALRDE
jgi:putative ABC transport system permease protein